MKDCFILLGEKMSLSKTTLFLSFQIWPEKTRESRLPQFSCFLLIRKVVQLIIKSFTRNGQAQSTLVREMKADHRAQRVEQ